MSQLEARGQPFPHPSATPLAVGRRRLETALGRPEEPDRLRVAVHGLHKLGRRKLETGDVAVVRGAGPGTVRNVLQLLVYQPQPFREQFGDWTQLFPRVRVGYRHLATVGHCCSGGQASNVTWVPSIKQALKLEGAYYSQAMTD